MNEPLVSVIVPVYKVEKYLCECVDSVLAQTYQNWELILVDDGSPDNCPAICDEYTASDSRIRVIHQENQTAGPARNTGYDASTGKYICFLDSDDSVATDYLEKLVEVAEEKQADMVICGYQQYDDQSKQTLLVKTAKDCMVSLGEKTHCVFGSIWSRLYLRDYLKHYGIRFEKAPIGEDTVYCLMTDLLTHKIATADTQYFYRYRKGSAMTTKCQARAWPYEALEKAIRMDYHYIKDDENDRHFLEYHTVRLLSGWLTLFNVDESSANRKALCAYTVRILRQYFPDVSHNPYLFGKKRKMVKGSVRDQLAMQGCVLAYRFHALFLFSTLTVLVLRFVRTLKLAGR